MPSCTPHFCLVGLAGLGIFLIYWGSAHPIDHEGPCCLTVVAPTAAPSPAQSEGALPPWCRHRTRSLTTCSAPRTHGSERFSKARRQRLQARSRASEVSDRIRPATCSDDVAPGYYVSGTPRTLECAPGWLGGGHSRATGPTKGQHNEDIIEEDLGQRPSKGRAAGCTKRLDGTNLHAFTRPGQPYTGHWRKAGRGPAAGLPRNGGVPRGTRIPHHLRSSGERHGGRRTCVECPTRGYCPAGGGNFTGPGDSPSASSSSGLHQRGGLDSVAETCRQQGRNKLRSQLRGPGGGYVHGTSHGGGPRRRYSHWPMAQTSGRSCAKPTFKEPKERRDFWSLANDCDRAHARDQASEFGRGCAPRSGHCPGAASTGLAHRVATDGRFRYRKRLRPGGRSRGRRCPGSCFAPRGRQRRCSISCILRGGSVAGYDSNLYSRLGYTGTYIGGKDAASPQPTQSQPISASTSETRPRGNGTSNYGESGRPFQLRASYATGMALPGRYHRQRSLPARVHREGRFCCTGNAGAPLAGVPHHCRGGRRRRHYGASVNMLALHLLYIIWFVYRCTVFVSRVPLQLPACHQMQAPPAVPSSWLRYAGTFGCYQARRPRRPRNRREALNVGAVAHQTVRCSLWFWRRTYYTRGSASGPRCAPRTTVRPHYCQGLFLLWLVCTPQVSGVQIWQHSSLQGQPVFTTSSVQPAQHVEELSPVRTPDTPCVDPVFAGHSAPIRSIGVFQDGANAQPVVMHADVRMQGPLLDLMLCRAFGLQHSCWNVRRVLATLPSLPAEQYILSPRTLPWYDAHTPVDLRPVGGRISLVVTRRDLPCGAVVDAALTAQGLID